LNLEERLIRDAESFAAEVGDFDEKALIARVCRTLGIADGESVTDNAPEAGHLAGWPAPAGENPARSSRS